MIHNTSIALVECPSPDAVIINLKQNIKKKH